MTTEPSTLQAVRRRLARARARRRADRRAARVGVCVVGPGKHFLSGMTYHTYGLVTALAAHGPTDAILLRNLVPRRLYPGESRVGADLSHLRLPPEVRRAERVDWWWVPGIFEAAWLLLRRPPAVLVVQWWSAAVWHTQLALVTLARLTGAKIVIEVHETIDSAESQHKLAGMWVRYLAPRLLAQADRVVVHSQADRALVTSVLDVEPERIEVVPEPPFDSYHLATPVRPMPDSATHRRPVELLFFGTIRPYKGLEDLVSAFDLLCDRDAGDHWRLTVVGETWEGWTEPNRRIAASPHRDRITFVNRYVPDEEVDGHFAAADVVVLPYHRSSTSGPLMVALSYGKPAVVTTVGGLPEAVEGYQGAVLVPPRDPMALAKGIVEAEHLIGTVHEAPRSWVDVAADHEAMYRRLGVRGRS